MFSSIQIMTPHCKAMMNSIKLNVYFSNSAYREFTRHKSSNSSFQYCLDTVRQYDYENFLSTILLDKSIRSYAFIIRAFNVEVSRVQELVSDQNIGLIRYQFWNDTLDKIYSKNKSNIPQHPVAQELFKVCTETSMPKRHLLKLLNSRKQNISRTYFNSLEEIEKYSEESVSPIYYLLLETSGLVNVQYDHAASHLGKAQGITNTLRSIEQSTKHKIVQIPMDILLKYNISQESVLRCTDNQSMRDAAYEIASRANNHLIKARSIAVPKEVGTLFLPAVAVDAYLAKLQKKDFNLFDKQLSLRNSLLPFSLYWNKLKSKY